MQKEVAASIAYLLLIGSCNRADPSSGPSSEANAPLAPPASSGVVLSEEQRGRVAALAREVDGASWRFKNEHEGRESASLYVHLAATHAEAPVVGAALLMMSRTYTNRPKAETSKEPVDAAFSGAVHRGLGWNDVRVVGRALLAGRVAVDGSRPDESVMDAVLGLANRKDFAGGAPRHAMLQFAVTNALTRRPKEVVALLTESLSAPEPFVLEYALRELARGRVMDDAPLVAARTRPLLKHADPVVRGAASELLGKLGSTARDVSATGLAMEVAQGLDAKEPYVRAQAALALGQLGHHPAIGSLAALLDDLATAEARLEGWIELEGSAAFPQTRSARTRTVREAALSALATLAAGKLDDDGLNAPEPPLDDRIARAKAWAMARAATRVAPAPPDRPRPGDEG